MNDEIAQRRDLLASLSDAGRAVFTTVLTRGPISRIGVAKHAGLSQAAVTKAITPLLSVGLVDDAHGPQRSGSRGRPASPIAIAAEAMSVVGIKVNTDELIGVVTDLRTRVLASRRVPLDANDPDTVVAASARLFARLEGYATGSVASLGISVSGDVDTASGVVRESNIMGWKGVDLGARLSRHVPVPVLVENDVHALTTGEHWFGVGVGTSSFAIVTIGRGIGSGLHLNGDVISGAYGVAGEIGHMPVASPDRICRCGRRGCLEAVASTTAIADAVSRAHRTPLSIADAVRLAHEGDEAAGQAFTEASEAIGTAIAGLINLVGPEIVIIGGEAVSNFDLFESPMRRAIQEHAFGAAGRCDIVARPHTFEDWARGAAAAAIRELVLPSRR